MDIDRELFLLISKYGIYREDPELLEFSYDKYTEEFLNELFDSLPNDGAVALWGLTEETKSIYEYLSHENKLKVDFVIDEDDNSYQDMGTVTTVTVKQSRFHNIRTVILTTFENRENIKKQLRESRTFLRVIDLYDYLKINGIIYPGGGTR